MSGGKSPAAAPVVSEGAGGDGGPGSGPARSGCCSSARLSPRQRLDSAASGRKMAAAGGGSSVNPFLSDSEEDEPEEARPGGGSSSSTEPGGPAYPARRREEAAAAGSPEELPGLRAAGDAAGAGGGAAAGDPPRVSMDAMAAQLLRDQFLLTALELHTELLESGRELPRLRDFFSNPGNFERQSGTPPAGGGLGGGVLGGAGGREPGSGQLSKCLLLAGAGSGAVLGRART